MIEFIIKLDTSLFLFLNGLNSPVWDKIMWIVSDKEPWIPLYLFMIFLMIRKFKWHAVISILLAFIVILLADQLSVHLFKDVFQRLRPCHNPEIKDLVHLVKNKCGGQYGFVSSHAANTFGLAVYTLLLFKTKWYTWVILFWAVLVSYSRIYLGVHFPLDVICGGLLGILIGFSVYKLFNYLKGIIIENKLFRK